MRAEGHQTEPLHSVAQKLPRHIGTADRMHISLLILISGFPGAEDWLPGNMLDLRTLLISPNSSFIPEMLPTRGNHSPVLRTCGLVHEISI